MCKARCSFHPAHETAPAAACQTLHIRQHPPQRHARLSRHHTTRTAAALIPAPHGHRRLQAPPAPPAATTSVLLNLAVDFGVGVGMHVALGRVLDVVLKGAPASLATAACPSEAMAHEPEQG